MEEIVMVTLSVVLYCVGVWFLYKAFAEASKGGKF